MQGRHADEWRIVHPVNSDVRSLPRGQNVAAETAPAVFSTCGHVKFCDTFLDE